jgi:hypothetical protein
MLGNSAQQCLVEIADNRQRAPTKTAEPIPRKANTEDQKRVAGMVNVTYSE